MLARVGANARALMQTVQTRSGKTKFLEQRSRQDDAQGGDVSNVFVEPHFVPGFPHGPPTPTHTLTGMLVLFFCKGVTSTDVVIVEKLP